MPEPASPPKGGRRPPRWARWALGALAVPLAFVGLPAAWEYGSLASIPDIGDPFDVAAFRREFPNDVPPERNAFHAYQLATATLQPGKYRVFRDILKNGENTPTEWRLAGPELRARVAENREALDIWREGTGRDEALYHRLEEMTTGTLLDVTQELRHAFTPLALLEGSRLEEEGDMAGAWGWYRALVRCSRHSGRHGFLIERLVGITIYRQATERIERWAADPRVDADLLRRAKQDLDEAEALRTPDEEVWKLECMIELEATRDPKQFRDLIQYSITQRQGGGAQPTTAFGRILAEMNPSQWLRQARVASGSEAERTRRIMQLVWANRLPVLCRPAADRPAPLIEDPLIYPADPATPEAARKIPPEELARRIQALPINIFSLEWYPRQIRAIAEEESARRRVGGELDRQIQLRESP
ncbi:MAG: hypothetical protein U0800_00560 [Isosphaeraceae bacterium]